MTEAAHVYAQVTRPRTYWSGVYAMSLCAFVLIASEFMPVSLLTPIARDLGVSEGQAGWGIGISGVFAVLTALGLPRWVGGRDRRSVLLALTALMGVSGAVIAAAPDYPLYMLGRALIGVVVGGFWSMSVAVAMRLVPPAQVPRAMAVFNGGNALATVLAAPLGSWLGSLMGWRGVFACLVPLALATMLWQRSSLPALPAPTPGQKPATTNVFTLLVSQRAVTLGMLACGLFFMGQFALFTYVRPFLETVTRVDNAQTLALILLVIGAAGVVGNAGIGRVLQRGLHGTLGSIAFVMAAIAASLVVWGANLPVVVVLLGVWGLLGTAAPVGWWSWLAQTLPHNAETGGALMVAVIQFSIGFGSILGGVLWDGRALKISGPAASFALAALLLLAAAACVCWLAKANYRTNRVSSALPPVRSKKATKEPNKKATKKPAKL